MHDELLANYEQLAQAADEAFSRIQRDHPEEVKCNRGCVDCCHALFGLFLIEALYLRQHFASLEPAVQQEILARVDESKENIKKAQDAVSNSFAGDERLQSYAMAKQRVRCPLLNDKGDCALYPFRPITCRVYGIPVTAKGSTHACWKAGFKQGRSYPAFNMDRVYQQLYQLSMALLETAGVEDKEAASLLIPVTTALTTPYESLIRGEVTGDVENPKSGQS